MVLIRAGRGSEEGKKRGVFVNRICYPETGKDTIVSRMPTATGYSECYSSGLGFAKQRGNGGSLVLLPMVIMSSLVGWHYFIDPVFNSLSRKEKT